MKKIIFLLCVSIGLNLYATTVGDLTSAVCKDATYPCDICSNESSTMAQCKCDTGTSWNSTLKICETAKDACTSPAYWNNNLKRCEAKVPSYVAPTDYPYIAWAVNGTEITSNQITKSSGKNGCTYAGIKVFSGENCGQAPFNYSTPTSYATLGSTRHTCTSNWWNDPGLDYICSQFTKKLCSDGTLPINGQCIELLTIAKPNNCSSPSTGVTSSGKCYQPTSCPLGNYSCTSTATGGGTIDNTDTTQGATDKTANGTTNSSGQCSGKIYIFNGKDMRCRPPGMQTGYSDCCTKTDSWFGLTKCGTSEVALGKARVSGNSGDGYCHYVGDYCAEEWNLGVTKICVQKKKTYCCFNGLLGRVIQEQGRPQLGIGWGSSEAPECRGFTPDEFQKLDFSKIDLGEFTQAVTANAAANINKNLGPQINAEIDRFNSTIK